MLVWISKFVYIIYIIYIYISYIHSLPWRSLPFFYGTTKPYFTFNRRPCDPKFRYQGLGFSTWTGSVEVSRMRKHQRSPWCHQLPFSYKLHPRKLTVFPWKLMVGRCIPYWNGHFLEDMLVFRGVLGGGFNGCCGIIKFEIWDLEQLIF